MGKRAHLLFACKKAGRPISKRAKNSEAKKQAGQTADRQQNKRAKKQMGKTAGKLKIGGKTASKQKSRWARRTGRQKIRRAFCSPAFFSVCFLCPLAFQPACCFSRVFYAYLLFCPLAFSSAYFLLVSLFACLLFWLPVFCLPAFYPLAFLRACCLTRHFFAFMFFGSFAFLPVLPYSRFDRCRINFSALIEFLDSE